ncbi:MAG: hypothetical protein C5B59_17400 [Bacteroidetes bacterium]|nr:MAG: hypothetical protein C5B59_17400 [Bacteroidota bacterium]
MSRRTKKQELELYDNTTIQDSRKCLRYLYYRHQRGIVTRTPRPALAFGAAWHRAMDVIWQRFCGRGSSIPKRPGPYRDYIEASVAGAMVAFEETWSGEYGYPGIADMDLETHKQLEPRTPTVAMDMLFEYIDQRKNFFLNGDIELLAVEEPFAVPLDPNNPNLFYVGRFDKKIRRNGRISLIEHKTTTAYSKANGFRTSVLESYVPNSQIDGYLYSANALIGPAFKEVLVDLALVHRSERRFRFIPVERDLTNLEEWLWTTHYYINNIRANKHALIETQESPIMAAFPQNTNSCIAFETTCDYLDLCKSWIDPRQRHIAEEDEHFEEGNFWSPFKELHLEKIFKRRKKT